MAVNMPPASEVNSEPAANDSAMPNAPPIRQTSTASIMNCCMMSPRRAPTAMRTPISWVRSVTETSMMFITPVLPITSEIEATIRISKLSVIEVRSIDLRN